MLLKSCFSLRIPLSNLRICASMSKFQSRNPREPHYDRKRMIEVCKPIYLPIETPVWETCKTNIVEEDTVHPYERILAKDIRKDWDSSKMVLFFHVCSLTEREHKEVRKAFIKKDLSFQICSPNVMKVAMEGTQFSSIHHLFESNTAVVFSDKIRIDNGLKVNKKVSQVALLAGIIENQFYSKNQLQKVSDLLKRDGLQELAQLLDYIPSTIKGTVNHHTQMLCHYLNQAATSEQ